MTNLKLGYHTICWGGVVGEPVGVTSIKNLFYRSGGDVERAANEIAELGYDGFEIFDGNLLDFIDNPSRFRRLLESTGLQLVAVYCGGNFIYPEILEEELWRVRKAAALAGQFDARHLVVGGGAQRWNGIEPDDYQRLGDSLDKVVAIAEESGLIAVFHPHLTTIVESPAQVEKLLSVSRIGLCADTAHLAAGGGDPAGMLRQHADRLGYVHLKDFRREPFGFLPLGEGELDMVGIVKTLTEIAYDGWATVELDSFDGAPKEAAAQSRRFLESMLGFS
ncbi:MAG: sugar phosphate isomerase/epimerase family protein [Acidimicrobiia bacterium]